MSMISESKTLTALAALHMHAPSQRLSFELFLPHLDSISESEPLMMVVVVMMVMMVLMVMMVVVMVKLDGANSGIPRPGISGHI